MYKVCELQLPIVIFYSPMDIHDPASRPNSCDIEIDASLGKVATFHELESSFRAFLVPLAVSFWSRLRVFGGWALRDTLCQKSFIG